MAEQLAHVILDRFAQRRDVCAIQYLDGSYSPIQTPLTPEIIQTHLDQTYTYGHYTTDQDNMTRIVAFDCDLLSLFHGMEFPDPNLIAEGVVTDENIMSAYKLLPHDSVEKYWFDRYNLKSRAWLKYKMRFLAEVITSTLYKAGLDCAAFYSGNRGIHVYGFFPEPIKASEARTIGKGILQQSAGLISHNCYLAEGTGGYRICGPGTTRGNSIVSHVLLDHVDGMPYFNIEIYPKQDEVPVGGYGNLLRLPLGRNLHSLIHSSHGEEVIQTRTLPQEHMTYVCQPAFMINQCSAVLELEPHPDPLSVLLSGSPWNYVTTGAAK